MLARMRGIEYVNQLFRYQVFDERPVDRHPAQGCLPSLSRAHRQSAEPDKVGGSQHDDTLYAPAGPSLAQNRRFEARRLRWASGLGATTMLRSRPPEVPITTNRPS